MSSKARTIGSVVVSLAALAFFVARVTDGPPTTPELPLDLAYHLCGRCGLETHEVDTLIDKARQSGLTRDEQIRLFEEAYIDGAKLDAASELCIPCVEAVLDAAFEDQRPRESLRRDRRNEELAGAQDPRVVPAARGSAAAGVLFRRRPSGQKSALFIPHSFASGKLRIHPLIQLSLSCLNRAVFDSPSR